MKIHIEFHGFVAIHQINRGAKVAVGINLSEEVWHLTNCNIHFWIRALACGLVCAATVVAQTYIPASSFVAILLRLTVLAHPEFIAVAGVNI